jgi:hypothetical protein
MIMDILDVTIIGSDPLVFSEKLKVIGSDCGLCKRYALALRQWRNGSGG